MKRAALIVLTVGAFEHYTGYTMAQPFEAAIGTYHAARSLVTDYKSSELESVIESITELDRKYLE